MCLKSEGFSKSTTQQTTKSTVTLQQRLAFWRNGNEGEGGSYTGDPTLTLKDDSLLLRQLDFQQPPLELQHSGHPAHHLSTGAPACAHVPKDINGAGIRNADKLPVVQTIEFM